MPDDLVDTKTAAEILQMSAKSLAIYRRCTKAMAARGSNKTRGPAVTMVGNKPMYSMKDIMKYDANRRYKSGETPNELRTRNAREWDLYNAMEEKRRHQETIARATVTPEQLWGIGAARCFFPSGSPYLTAPMPTLDVG